jgi:hypothetical protein
LDENDDYVFLSSKPDPGQKVIGFNTLDDYKSVPLKFVEFFRKAHDSYFEFDWTYFCDDDTFVFPKRLRNLLSHYDSQIPICVGRKGVFKTKSKVIELVDRIFRKFPKLALKFLILQKNLYASVIEYPSGGAGFAISKPAMMKLREYLREADYNYRKFTFSDVTFGYWLMQTEIPIIDRSDVLKAQNPRHPENQGLDVNTIVSYHYCDEDDFTQLYSSITKYDSGVNA